MDDFEVRATTDRILDMHQRGQRSYEKTLENLTNIFDLLDPAQHSKFFDYLCLVLVRELSKKPVPQAQGQPNSVSPISVITRAIGEFGPAADLFPRLFEHLHWTDPTVVDNWVIDVLSQMIVSISVHPERFTKDALDRLRGQTIQYTVPGSEVRFPIKLVSRIFDLQRLIEDVEFSRFEQQLRDASGDRSKSTQVNELPVINISSNITRAMKEAEQYLRSNGPFDPKKAADLIRTSMDEFHRQIVNELSVLSETKYDGQDKDGERRSYMRKVEFISEPEEAFFTAVYSLLSREGTHKLIAAKETVLVILKTVRDYQLLLWKRLSDLKNKPIKASA